LVAHCGGAALPLVHVHRETFALSADGALAAADGKRVLFVTGFAGEVEALRMELEPSLPAITFTRRAAAALTTPPAARDR
jgi:hypothetical protein